MSQSSRPIDAPTTARLGLASLAGGLGFSATEWLAARIGGHPLDPEPSPSWAAVTAIAVAGLAGLGGWSLRRRDAARGVAIGLAAPALLWAPEAMRAAGVSTVDLPGLLLAVGVLSLAWRWPRLGLGFAVVGALARPLATALRGPVAGTCRSAGWPAAEQEHRAASDAPDILLITVDTVRADGGLTDGGLLDALPGTWDRYEEAISAAPWTLPAMISVMTGQPVREHGGGLPLPPAEGPGFTAVLPSSPWLPAQLSARGYVTAAVICNPHLRASQGFARGFSRLLHHDDARDPQLLRHAVDELHRWASADGRVAGSGTLGASRDARIEAAALQLITAERRRPRFVWVHLLDPHEYRRQVAGTLAGWEPGTRDPALLRAAYAINIEAAAARVARLAAAASDWVVVVTSDHGEALGEGGRWGHGHTLDDIELRVPLAIHWPTGGGGGHRGQVAVADVAPLLLSAEQGAQSMPTPTFVEVGGLRRDAAAFARRATDGAYVPTAPGRVGPGVPWQPALLDALEALGYVQDAGQATPGGHDDAPR